MSQRKGEPVASLEQRLAAFRYDPDEDLSGLLELPETAVELDSGSGEGQLELLCFGIGEAEYAVPLRAVREILRAQRLTELPRAKAPLLGILNLRGTITPVYDPAIRLGRAGAGAIRAGPEAVQPPRPARILILETLLGAAGLWVDRVRGVVRVEGEAMQRPPPGTPAGVLGLVAQPGVPRAVLDPEQLLR
jgi:purine-binding chemotaxis protein CheW